MQAWDQVIVTEGEHREKAGLVQHVEGDTATVKLDLEDEPVQIAVEDLRLLGR